MLKSKVLKITGTDNSIIYKGRIIGLPINEEVVLQKSMEFFSDPAPCFIHRSAVLNRLYAEIEEFLDNGLISHRAGWLWSELPCQVQKIMRQNSEIYLIEYVDMM